MCTEGLCAVDGERKKTTYICVPSWHSRGWCLLARFGVCLCGLAWALVLSIHSHLRSRSCACLWEALMLSCNERSQQENKALFFQSSGSDASTALIQPPLKSFLSWGWLMTAVALDGIFVGVLFKILIRHTWHLRYSNWPHTECKYKNHHNS